MKPLSFIIERRNDMSIAYFEMIITHSLKRLNRLADENTESK